ncbi:aminoglycoside adenylyltransferase domain-containing protein [Neobacillus terrae]|uniref:aminoglycoside adenylyltransferase domain-containing protein n=1 Tax=Neobacillus terrae TaxID=3034837 RepID=UPI001407ABA9|nr:aminoglycoside adenylyltransferase domain-containing protein [Neobacillus terrae]NHM30835.1 DUF4111 domain-containing protein [Neobacillus terrae]
MSRIPKDAYQLLDDYITLWKKRLPNKLKGLYLHGSIVLDAYIKDSSDIDFIAITENRLRKDEVQELSEIHHIISNKYKKPEMDGVYILWEDLGNIATYDNSYYPYYNGGKMAFDTHFNPVTWWLLKTRGINILGPNRTELRMELNQQELISFVLENMNTYWATRVHRLENSKENLLKLSAQEIDFEVEWTVLGLLRQYYTLKEYDFISKMGAGDYGLIHMPEEWHSIIREAINIRRGVKARIFPAKEERINSALSFPKYLMKHCQELVES